MQTITVRGRRLEYVRLPSAHPKAGAPAMVFLHEGLGSIAMWRDFPQRVSDATGCEAVVYSRQGYGRSDPDPEARTPRYMHREALEMLPDFLDALNLRRPFLFGHSDGGSIALIHAGGAGREVAGVIAVAPHLMVEDITLAGIRLAKEAWQSTDLRGRLGRYHNDVDRVFSDWNDTWLSAPFRDWNIEEYVPPISAPILAIQGVDDEYATLEQIHRIARLNRDVDLVELADCRHSPHKDQPDAVIEATAGFVARVLD